MISKIIILTSFKQTQEYPNKTRFLKNNKTQRIFESTTKKNEKNHCHIPSSQCQTIVDIDIRCHLTRWRRPVTVWEEKLSLFSLSLTQREKKKKKDTIFIHRSF